MPSANAVFCCRLRQTASTRRRGEYDRVVVPERHAAAPKVRRCWRSNRAASLDDLVGAEEQRLRHGQTECGGGFQVDEQSIGTDEDRIRGRGYEGSEGGVDLA